MLSHFSQGPVAVKRLRMRTTVKVFPDTLEDLYFQEIVGAHGARLPACTQFLLSPRSRVLLKTCLFEFQQHAVEV